MAEDCGKQPLGILTRERVGVGMAYSGRLNLDQDLPLPGSVKIDGFDLERGAGLVCDSGLDLHTNAPRLFPIFFCIDAATLPRPNSPRLLADQDHPVTNRAAAVGVEHIEGHRFAAA